MRMMTRAQKPGALEIKTAVFPDGGAAMSAATRAEAESDGSAGGVSGAGGAAFAGGGAGVVPEPGDDAL